MISYFQSVIYGVVEGITEFLPVSSTGHLILTSKILHIGQSDFVKSFEIAIQLGAILSVIVLYYKNIFSNWKIIKKVIIAFIPTAILGFLLYKIVKKYLLGNTEVVLWSLLIGGIVIILFELFLKEQESHKEKIEDFSLVECLTLGLFQSIAMIPGVSRSAATIIGGLTLGLKRKTIVEFSFLLAVPTMLAATGYDIIKNSGSFLSNQLEVMTLGFTVSFVVAIFSIKFLINFIQKHTFISFGIYRIILALIFLLIK